MGRERFIEDRETRHARRVRGFRERVSVGLPPPETEASELKAGDAVPTSAAQRAAGQILIQLCRLVKLNYVLYESDAFEDTKAWLEFLGAARVFCYEDVIADELKREHSSLPKLAFRRCWWFF